LETESNLHYTPNGYTVYCHLQTAEGEMVRTLKKHNTEQAFEVELFPNSNRLKERWLHCL
jgi:hypothetical protein